VPLVVSIRDVKTFRITYSMDIDLPDDYEVATERLAPAPFPGRPCLKRGAHRYTPFLSWLEVDISFEGVPAEGQPQRTQKHSEDIYNNSFDHAVRWEIRLADSTPGD
jgi:hypothetical protein